jgi:DNA topoisomerase-2
MKIFRPEDGVGVQEDDGIKIEPTFYVPIIPMVLVNSSIGIGTGFSTCIPSFDPLTSSTTPEDTHCPKNYNR